MLGICQMIGYSSIIMRSILVIPTCQEEALVLLSFHKYHVLI